MKHSASFVIRIMAVSFLSIFIFLSETGYGQGASATWALTANTSSTVVGHVTAGAATAGSLVTNWPNVTGCGTWSDGYTGNGTPDSLHYIQFTFSPAPGYNLNADSFLLHTDVTNSLGTLATGGEIAAMYSLDGFATAGINFTGTQFDDATCTTTQQDVYKFNGGTGVTVPNGGTLTVRLYGYVFNTTSDRFYVSNVECTGTTSFACITPTITSFTPTHACSGSGATITINGSNFVSGLTTVTINGTPAMPVTYVNSGQVTVSLPAGASGSGNIVITTPCPVTSSTPFTVDTTPALSSQSATACGGAAFSYTPTGTTPTGITYAWAAPTLGSGLTGGVSGSGQATLHDILTNTTAAPVTAIYTVTPTSGSCVGGTFTVTVTVRAPLAVIGSQSTTTCTAATFSYTPTGTIAGGTTYGWAVPTLGAGLTGGVSGTGQTSISDNLTNTTVTFVTATYSVTPSLSGCTGSAFALTVKVYPEASIASQTSTACSTVPFSYTPTGSIPNGTTYAWAAPILGTGLTGGVSGTGQSTINDNLNNTTTAAVTATYTVTPTSGSCTGAVFTVTVTVNPSATIPAQTTTVCSGVAFSYTAMGTIIPPGTTYAWAVPTVGAGITGGASGTGQTTINDNLTNTAAAPVTATYSVTPTSGSCTGSIFTVTATVIPPLAVINSQGTSTCTAIAFSYTPTGTIALGTTYAWAAPALGTNLTGGVSGTGQTVISDILTNTTVTFVTATYSVTPSLSGCTGSAFTLTVRVNPVPATPATIFGRATECLGALDSFGVLPVTGATSYTWSLPNGWTTIGSTINAITGLAGSSGTVSVTANNACGASVPQTFAVTVDSVPPTPGAITGATSVCPGGLDTLSIAPVWEATSYVWTLPNGWTGTSATDTIIATAAATAGTVTVMASNACGNSPAQTFAVTIGTPPPTPGTISGFTFPCSGTLDTLYIAPVNGATSYTWTLPNGWTGTSTTDTLITTAGSAGGNVTVKANNACGSSSASVSVLGANTVPPIPGVVFSRTSGCTAGSPDTFSVAPVSGATSYTWTLPSGWTGTSTSDSIISSIGTNAGTLSVVANNVCGSSAAQTLAVGPGSAPATPVTILGAPIACGAGSTDTLSVAPVSGATSYTWTLPFGWTGSSTTNTIVATATSNGGIVTVQAVNNCGSSPLQTRAITIGSAPVSVGSITSSASGCNTGAMDTFSVAAVSGATSYTWTLPGGWIGTSTTNTIIAIVGASGTVSVTANNSCGSTTPSTLAVTSVPALPTPGAISGQSVVCSGGIDTFSIAPVSGAASYIWTLPNGWTGTSSTTSIITTTTATAGYVIVEARNGCAGSLPQALPVSTTSIIPPTPGLIGGPSSVCAGATDSFYIVPLNSASLYTWTLPSGWIGTSTTNSIIATAGSAGGLITVTAQNGCGTSTAQIKTDTVNPLPTVVFDYGNPVCQGWGDIVTLNMATPAGGDYSGPGVTGNTFFSTDALSAGNYVLTYTYTSPAGCTASDTANFNVITCAGIINTGADQIGVYPNPFTEEITINTNGSYGNGTAILSDAAGREVKRIEFNAGVMSAQINTSSLTGGMYLLSISVGGKLIEVKKLVRTE